MEDKRNTLPNIMPDAMVEPITDMELIVAKLKHDGKASRKSAEYPSGEYRK